MYSQLLDLDPVMLGTRRWSADDAQAGYRYVLPRGGARIPVQLFSAVAEGASLGPIAQPRGRSTAFNRSGPSDRQPGAEQDSKEIRD